MCVPRWDHISTYIKHDKFMGNSFFFSEGKQRDQTTFFHALIQHLNDNNIVTVYTQFIYGSREMKKKQRKMSPSQRTHHKTKHMQF